jgi:hypothetical protein
MTLYVTGGDRSLHALWGDEKNAVVAKLPTTATKKQQETLVGGLTGLSEELRRTFGGDTFLPYGGASSIYRRGRRKHSIEIVRTASEDPGFWEGMVPRPTQYHDLGSHAEDIRGVLREIGDPTLTGNVEAEVQREIDALEAAEDHFFTNRSEAGKV